jgi:hypothetical protein
METSPEWTVSGRVRRMGSLALKEVLYDVVAAGG